MSAERSLEAWEEINRQGHDLADRLTQSFTTLLLPHINININIKPPNPSLLFTSWPSVPTKSPFADLNLNQFDDIGNRINQVSSEIGATLNGVVNQFFGRLPLPLPLSLPLPLPFSKEENHEQEGMTTAVLRAAANLESRTTAVQRRRGIMEFGVEGADDLLDDEDEDFGSEIRGASGRYRNSPGSVNITSTYDSRTQDIESSLTAKGDLWRIEASNGGSTSGNQSAPLFLVKLGSVLLLRDKTLLLPIPLPKQQLLWYGYNQKHGMHSLCPALWSKQRRWLLVSVICLSPIACSFMDLQFPNGQLTYDAGEGLTMNAFLPVSGGLLQAQGQYPGETKLSFSCKNKWRTRITPMVQWPDKSFSLGITHPIAWKSSGLMVRPTIHLSVCPTIGGHNPGVHAELIHTVREQLNLICGCAYNLHPSAYASLSIGRSKWSGNVGNTGMVIRVESPLSNMGRPYFSVQLNSGFEL